MCIPTFEQLTLVIFSMRLKVICAGIGFESGSETLYVCVCGSFDNVLSCKQKCVNKEGLQTNQQKNISKLGFMNLNKCVSCYQCDSKVSNQTVHSSWFVEQMVCH